MCPLPGVHARLRDPVKRRLRCHIRLTGVQMPVIGLRYADVRVSQQVGHRRVFHLRQPRRMRPVPMSDRFGHTRSWPRPVMPRRFRHSQQVQSPILRQASRLQLSNRSVFDLDSVIEDFLLSSIQCCSSSSDFTPCACMASIAFPRASVTRPIRSISASDLAFSASNRATSSRSLRISATSLDVIFPV
jgi:hypothetical protein